MKDGAKALIETLMAIVDNEGAIVMPSFKHSSPFPLDETDRRLGLTLKIKNLQDDEEPSGMGIISDTFRKMPGVVTGQGLFRVSAWGKDRDKHAQGFQYLIDINGWALLLGVDIYSMSSMHYVEDIYLPRYVKNLSRLKKPASCILRSNGLLRHGNRPSGLGMQFKPQHTKKGLSKTY